MNIDFDEIRPDRFIIHNDKVRPFLRGEGVTVGKFFDLVTWRRDGLIARIRNGGFNVRTLADRLAALREISAVGAPEGEGIRPLSTAKERIATFDRSTLRWRDVPMITHNGKPAVKLHGNVALRRRKSRGKPDFYISALIRDDQINLLPVSETEALLHAYGQIAASDQPAIARFWEQPDAYVVPSDQLLLPPPHAALLDLLSADKQTRWTFPSTSAGLVEAVFAKLGIELQRAEQPKPTTGHADDNAP